VSGKALIITDGTDHIQSIAQSISEELTGYEVKTCPAEKFEGTDLLPADIFFIGCENPEPSSFSYLEDMLTHINLASRKCGIFSVNENALKYLSGILKDCETNLIEPFLVENAKADKAAVKNWLKGMV